MYDIEEAFIDSKTVPEYTYKFRQCLLAIICMLQAVCAGCTFAFSSVLSEKPELGLDTNQFSWIASIPTLSILPMVLTAGWILNVLGRRLTMALTIAITLIAWILLYFSHSYEMLFASRLLTGIYTGLAYPVMLIYLAEVTDPKIRPQCLTSVPFGCNLGIMLTQLLGSFIAWRTLTLLISAMPVINFGLILYMDESYIWLLNKNRVNDAKCAFIWYRGSGFSAKSEFLSVLDSEIKEPFLLTTLLFLTSELSGDGAVIFYTSNIIKSITNNSDAQFYSNLVLNILRVVATLLSTLLFNKFSARSVLIFSGYLLAISLGNFALFLHLSRIYPDYRQFQVMCLILILTNVTFFGLGVGPGPTVICGEVYPSVLREIGGALSAFVLFGTLFGIVKVMPCLFEAINHELIFLIFACCTFVGVTMIYYVLPNTKNKTLRQLELFYES